MIKFNFALSPLFSALPLFFLLDQETASARYDICVVQQDLITLNEVFEIQLNLDNFSSIGEFKPDTAKTIEYQSPKRAYRKPFTPVEYVGYFLSKDTIEYLIETTLRKLGRLEIEPAYSIKSKLFTELLAKINLSGRNEIIYQIISENIRDFDYEQRILTHHLLRSWTLHLLKTDDAYNATLLLTPAPQANTSDAAKITPFQPSIREHFFSMSVLQYVLKDLLIAWENANQNQDQEALEELPETTLAFRKYIYGMKPFPAPSILQDTLKTPLNYEMTARLFAQVDALLKKEAHLKTIRLLPHATETEPSDQNNVKARKRITFASEVSISRYKRAGKGPIKRERELQELKNSETVSTKEAKHDEQAIEPVIEKAPLRDKEAELFFSETISPINNNN
jgi:hypothetical protein